MAHQIRNQDGGIHWAWFVAPPVMFCAGVFVLWPYLKAEHARLAFWEIPLVWLGEATAFVWYAIFVVRSWAKHGTSAQDVAEDSQQTSKHSILLFIVTLVLGTSVDVGIAFLALRNETDAQKRSVAVVGEVERGKAYFKKGGYNYLLFCRFTDGTGTLHSVRMSTPYLPEAVGAPVRAKAFPVKIELAYDPIRPQRCWIGNIAEANANRLCFMSLMTVLFQVILSFAFYFSNDWEPSSGTPPVESAPFIAACGVMTMFSLFSLFLNPV